MVTLLSRETLPGLVGQSFPPGEWVEVTQERINKFAEATDDFQWIHVDVEKAKAGPYGKTIAHGLLTLSMIGALNKGGVFKFDGFKMGVNYGYDKVRFPTPVPVGSMVRLVSKVLAYEDLGASVQTIVEHTVEVQGSSKPACVSQMIFRHS